MSVGLFRPILVLFLLAGCATKAPDPGRSVIVPPNDCSRGAGTAQKDAPVVCVSSTPAGIVVHPESIELWDVLPSDKTKPVTIHWITRSGSGDLQIRMKDEGCIEKLECNKNGHCHAKAIDVTGSKQCDYGITLDGRELDPEVIIVDCC